MRNNESEAILKDCIASAAARIRSSRRIVVAGHRDPDGDTLGASLGLALALRADGYDVQVVNADPPLERAADASAAVARAGLAAIPGAELVVSWEQIDEGQYDCVVLVDCSTLDRLHFDPEVPRRVVARTDFVLVIDHHVAPSPRSGAELGSHVAGEPITIVDPQRASSAELVALLIEAARLPIDRDVATALLTGIATDTKGFLRDSTDARALARASQLRATGGDLSVAEDILQRHGAGFLQVAGDVLRRAVVIGNGAGIVASIPRHEITAVRSGELERLTTILTGTREAYAIVLLQDLTDEIRGSVRTRAPVDAVSIARQFGGGGHARRSGFRVQHASLDDLLDRVIVTVRDAVSSTHLG